MAWFEATLKRRFLTIQTKQALGLDRLKAALMALGVKCGGTLQERAARLWSLRGVTDPSQVRQATGLFDTKKNAHPTIDTDAGLCLAHPILYLPLLVPLTLVHVSPTSYFPGRPQAACEEEVRGIGGRGEGRVAWLGLVWCGWPAGKNNNQVMGKETEEEEEEEQCLVLVLCLAECVRSCLLASFARFSSADSSRLGGLLFFASHPLEPRVDGDGAKRVVLVGYRLEARCLDVLHQVRLCGVEWPPG